jgi:predicted membrane chloride channel (bestrophin family)
MGRSRDRGTWSQSCSRHASIVLLLYPALLIPSAHALAPPGRLVIPSRVVTVAPLRVLKEMEESMMPACTNPAISDVLSRTEGNDSIQEMKLKAPCNRHEEAPDADHRYSASDWWQIIRSLPSSSVLRATRGPVLAVMVWSCFLSALNSSLRFAGYPGAAQFLTCSIPSTLPHSATVSALGLLLVFRTNSAYQKFKEGRLIWEHILSISRSLTRMVYLYPEFSPERRQRIFRLLAAYPYLLHRHVQPNYIDVKTPVIPRSKLPSSLRERLRAIFRRLRSLFAVKGFVSDKRVVVATERIDRHALPWSLFSDKAVQLCAKSYNRPLWVCDRMGQEIQQVSYTNNYTNQERSKFLLCIGQLSTAVSECERIQLTAVPLNYARHSLRGLTLWLFTLPLALMKNYGWWTAPVMGLAAWLMYGIYQIGYTIEDPFQGSLRLATLCDGIFRDVMCDERRATAFNVTMSEHEEWRDLPL